MTEEKKTAELSEKELNEVSGGSIEIDGRPAWTKQEISQQSCSGLRMLLGAEMGHAVTETPTTDGGTELLCSICRQRWIHKPDMQKGYYVKP